MTIMDVEIQRILCMDTRFYPEFVTKQLKAVQQII
jgi:hypothetical protein